MNHGLLVIGDINYPTGSAPSNRVHLYCKAINDYKIDPFIINVSSGHANKQHYNYLSRHESIPFYYCQKSHLYQKNFFKRNIRKIAGVFNSFIVIKRLKNKRKLTVLFYSLNTYYEIVYFLYLKLLGIPIIQEYNEAPLFVINNKKYQKFHLWMLQHLKLKMYDGLIVISDYLNNYFSKIYPSSKISQIPILVDMSRFENIDVPKKSNKKTLTYIGYMGGTKDGVQMLLEAIAKVKLSIDCFKLQLVGYGPEKDIQLIKKKVKELNIQDNVLFLGSKTSAEIPKILLNSDLLVLARPNNNQAKAGFPTKLGEYLASKRPVLITLTGEIGKYLKDNENAYVVEPDNNDHFANKLIYALNDPKSAQIAENGYNVANKNFNYKLYKNKLQEIFNLLSD